MTRAVVLGSGSAVPPRILSNDELSRMVDTNDEWIVQRTGIRERRVTSPEETSSTLGTEAARKALTAANTDPGEIDLVVCATTSPDYPWPSVACLIQDAVGATTAGAFDLSAACAGFVYALSVGGSMISAGSARKVLVVGADTLTKQVDWEDRATCILFGDGAGAVVLGGREDSERGLIDSVLYSDGSGSKHLLVEAGGGRYPKCQPHSEGKRASIYMAGREVYRFGVNAMPDACEKLLAKTGYTADDIDLFVPHQANIRIIDSAAERLGIPMDKVFVNLERYGNTSGASIPLALDEAVQQGRLKKGMLVMTVGFGGGLAWGANLVRW
ncbi:ketoacyl-ACP synthase III [bacterium]|nr:MAG: ketoacyl-ACP synthase III [bacterium]